MHKKFSFSIVILLSIHVLFSQSTKSKTFSLKKEKDAILFEIKEPKTIYIHSFSNDKKLKVYKERGSIGRLNSAYKNKFLSINYTYPDFISSLEINNAPVRVVIKEEKNDKGQMIRNIIYISQITANQHIVDRGKGLMHTHKLDLKDPDIKYPIDNVKRYNRNEFHGVDYYKTTFIAKNVSDMNLKAYVRKNKNGSYIATKIYREKVNLIQIGKLNKLAISFLNNLFFKKPYYEKLDFYYIKKFKNHDITAFNKAFNNVETYFNSKDKDKALINESITIWKDEISKLDLNEKKQKKLYKKGLKNIVKAFYALNQIDSTVLYAKKYQAFVKSTKKLSFYTNLTKKSNIPFPVNYEPIPSKLKIATHYNKKSVDKINPIISYKSIDISNYFHLLLVSKLTSKDIKSSYSSKKVFVSINQTRPKIFKKNQKNTYTKLKEYKKEVKSLFRNQDYNSFFNKHSFKELAGFYSKDLIIENFNTKYDKKDAAKRDLILLLFDYYYQISMIRNHKLDAKAFLKAKKNTALKLTDYIANSKKPTEEVINEVLNDLKLTDSPKKISDLSNKQIQILQSNIIRACSKIIPY